MKKLLALIGLPFIFASCASVKTATPNGTYYGYLPCDDCPGISYELELTENATYITKTRYEGNKDIHIHQGTFGMDGNHVMLIGDTGPAHINRLEVITDTLWALDTYGKRYKGTGASNYALTHAKPENFSMKLKKASIENAFIAHGNEPSWSLKIINDKTIEFKTLDDHMFKLTTPVPEPNKPQDVKALNYSIETESGSLQITIFNRNCIDDMSGESFGHKVTVHAQQGEMETPVKYEGCGDYTGDYRLNDIWVLTHIDDEAISTDHKAPNLEFSIYEGRVSGFSGCNRIHGNFEFLNQQVKISQLTSTLMACDNAEVEKQFMSIIDNSTMNYEIGKLSLKLWNDTHSLTFKKID